MWALSLIFVGLFKLMNKNKFGFPFLIFGLGLHPIGFFPIVVYYISSKFNFKTTHIFYSLLIGFLVKVFATKFSLLASIPFLGNKINTYMLGDWANYRFHEMGEYVKFSLLIILICYLIIVFKFKFIKNTSDPLLLRYNRFIVTYLVFSFLFIGFRTISTRLILDSIIIFFPLFYQVLTSRKIFKKRMVSFIALFVWVLMIDIRSFNLTNTSYQIGSGFPLNLFDSPLIMFFNKLI